MKILNILSASALLSTYENNIFLEKRKKLSTKIENLGDDDTCSNDSENGDDENGIEDFDSQNRDGESDNEDSNDVRSNGSLHEGSYCQGLTNNRKG